MSNNGTSFYHHVESYVDVAAAHTKMPQGLIDQIKACNSVLQLRFPVKIGNEYKSDTADFHVVTDHLGCCPEVRALLRRIPGLSDIEDDLPYGKQELVLEVTPRGRALGFTTESVGRQVRNAFEGVIAKRFPRGDEEVAVRVQYPRGTISEAALRDLYLRAPGGSEVPLSDVVEVTETSGFARIRREDGQRQVSIIAEVDEDVTTSGAVVAALGREGVPEIAARHGLTFDFKGKAEEQDLALGDLRTGAFVALAAIYIILAWVFGSYVQPLVVMSIIPFGIIGAVFGHLVMGFDITMLSLVALLGLSGILVNDSIILVSVINERRGRGEDAFAAIVGGTQDRLRAVLLTSLTTIGGLLPLMFETSLQARFLVPMAVTIVFGLIVATFLVLLVVPALMGIVEDATRAQSEPAVRKAHPRLLARVARLPASQGDE